MLGPCEYFVMMVPSVICKFFPVYTCYTEQPSSLIIFLYTLFLILSDPYASWSTKCLLQMNFTSTKCKWYHTWRFLSVTTFRRASITVFATRTDHSSSFLPTWTVVLSIRTAGITQRHTFPFPARNKVAMNYIPMGHVPAQHFCSHKERQQPNFVRRTGTAPTGPGRDQTKHSTETKQQIAGSKLNKYQLPLPGTKLHMTRRTHPPIQPTIHLLNVHRFRETPAVRPRCTHSTAYIPPNSRLILTN